MFELNERIIGPTTTASAATPVIIAGAGPVGLALALGLARAGVRSILVERKSTTSARSKAPAIHIRTREIFRQWSVEAQMLAEGKLLEQLTMHSATPGQDPLLSVDFSELAVEAERPGILFLEQGNTERILLEAVQATGLCDVRFDTEVVGVDADAAGAHVTIQSGERVSTLRAEYVVGCDGASSFVRQALGLDFEGITYSVRPMLADVLIRDERDALPWPRLYNGSDGITTALRLRPGHWRIIRLESTSMEREDEVSASELQERLVEVLGEGPAEFIWASRFRIHLRHAPRFRVGRVLLAGDAAHVHSPAGGLGMNAGIQDAHNLAWKLAVALAGGDAERLLASYDIERRAVAVEDVSSYADFITRAFLLSPRPLRNLAFALLPLVLKLPWLRHNALRRTTMIDLAYPPSPLLKAEDSQAGHRLPDVVLVAPGGSEQRGGEHRGTEHRLYDLLSDQPALIDVEPDGGADQLERLNLEKLPLTHIQIGRGHFEDPSGKLRQLVGGRGGLILVRPDRHIAWARPAVQVAPDAIQDALGLPYASSTASVAAPRS